MKKIIIIIFLFILSCSNNKVVNKHGASALELKFKEISIEKTNKNDILKLLGRPSSISTFDENSWFYIEIEKENQSVFKLGKTKIRKNNVLKINFNNMGLVNDKKIYNLNDMNDLKIVKNITEKKYDKKSTIQKFLNSMEQKINSPMNTKEK